MKIYSPIKSGGGSVSVKTEGQLSQIISIHPDKAAENGEKLLIADGKTYNAGDIQMRELKDVYPSVYQNTETGESVALTYDIVDISTYHNLEKIGGLLVEDNNNDKFLLLANIDREVSTNAPDATKINVYKMESGQSTFTLFKTIDFGEESWYMSLGKSENQLSECFNFDPETGNLYTVVLKGLDSFLGFNKINDINDTNGFTLIPITRDDSFDDIDFFYNFGYFFNWNDKLKVIEGVTAERFVVDDAIKYKLVTIEINPLTGQATKLGELKKYSFFSIDDEEYLDNPEVMGRYFKDNSGKIFHTRVTLDETSEGFNSFIRSSFNGLYSNDNPYYNQKFSRSSSFQTSDMVIHMFVSDLYSHPETGETLPEPHYCLFEFDRNFNCKIIDFKPESYMNVIYNQEINSFNFEETRIRTSKEGVTTMCFIEEPATGLGYDNHITCFEYKDNGNRLIQIMSNTGDTITDGTNTFNIAKSDLNLTHLTSEYYLIHSYSKFSLYSSSNYAIVKIPNSFTGGIIDSQDLEVIKVVNKQSGALILDRIPYLYYDNLSSNVLFTAEFRNYVNNGEGVDNTIDFVVNSGQFSEKITVPDRTAYNDPNGLVKDYIIKSVKGIKGTTTGE